MASPYVSFLLNDEYKKLKSLVRASEDSLAVKNREKIAALRSKGQEEYERKKKEVEEECKRKVEAELAKIIAKTDEETEKLREPFAYLVAVYEKLKEDLRKDHEQFLDREKVPEDQRKVARFELEMELQGLQADERDVCPNPECRAQAVRMPGKIPAVKRRRVSEPEEPEDGDGPGPADSTTPGDPVTLTREEGEALQGQEAQEETLDLSKYPFLIIEWVNPEDENQNPPSGQN